MTALVLSPPYPHRREPLEAASLPSWAVERRVRLAAAAVLEQLAAHPLGASDHLDRYARLLFPHDPPVRALAYARTMSSCALWALALWRLLGAEGPELDGPYRPGRAVADVVALGRRWGAWRAAGEAEPAPLAGDVLLIAPPEHVAVREGPGAWVDGGQGPGGRAIRRVERALERRGDRWHLGARAAVGWVDLGAVPTPRAAYVPLGAELDG